MSKLLSELKSAGATTPDARSAQFRTAICLVQNGAEQRFEGLCKGTIALERSGAQGFGYDPTFTPEGIGQTFAEMDANAKNAISHRGRAVRAMVDSLRT